MLTSRIKKSFNKAAALYDQYNALQMSVGETLLKLLPDKEKTFHRILDAGCGTGSVTKKFATSCLYKQFDGIDLAENLLKKATENLKPFAINLAVSDFNDLTVQRYYDLIYSNMALHWSPQINQTLSILKRALSKRGKLLFSIPLSGTLTELQGYCAIHPFYSQKYILSLLEKFNFKQSKVVTEKIVLNFPDWKSALYSLKHVGANYASQTFCGLFINKNLKNLINTPIEKEITFTYYVGYFMSEI